MRKHLLVLIALLVIPGIALAHSVGYDPATGMSQTVVPVYNNSGGALDAGDVVIWDIDASTGDNDAYVNTTTTAETAIVAGVVWPSAIAASSSGSIVVWGYAECDIDAGGATAAGPICTSSTAGSGQACTDSSVSYGHVTVTQAGAGQANCFVNP